MKKLLKLLGLLFIASILSNNVFAQITVVDAVIVDGDNNGYYGTLEIQFSGDLHKEDIKTSAVTEDEWIFSLSPIFADTLYAKDVKENVAFIFTGPQTPNDEYVQVTFDEEFASSSGPVYFRYTNSNGTFIDNNAETDTLFSFPVFAARDFSAPVIDDVVSNATDVDTLLVGESITFTVSFLDTVPDPNLTITPITYNGGNLNWNTSDAGKTYTGTYTVVEGHDDQLSDELQLENVYAEDQYGNKSITAFDGTDVKKYIDAHTPTIVSVVSNAASVDTLLVDETIIFTVDIDDSNPDPNLIITPLQYNGRNLNWGQIGGGDSYQGTYTNSNGGIDQATPLQLTGVVAMDPAGNISNTVSSSNVAVAIDANEPEINTVISDATAPGTLIVGDTITFTVDLASSPDGSLTVSPPKYNGRLLNWYTGDGGSTYTGKYIVTNGDPDQTTAIDLLGVTLTDPAGNVSNSEDGVVNKTIDANLPNITSVSITAQDRKILEDGEIFINIDADSENADYTIVSGNVEGFAIHTPTRVDNLQLQALFTVTNNNINIEGDDDVNVISLQVQDKAGNKSNIVSPVISQGGDALYGKMPKAQIFGTESICKNDTTYAPVLLTGIPPFKITYFDGTNSTPITNILDTYYNVEAIADSSNGTPIIFTITNVEDATGNSQIGEGTSFTLNINGLPNVHFSNPLQDNTFDISIDTVNLSANPPGGTFYGDGVISTYDIFDPSASGPAGWKTLYYDYTNINGCRDADTITVEVIEGGTIVFTEGTEIYCSYASTFGIEGINNDGKIGTFTLEDDPGGGAIVPDGDNKALIDPQKLNARSYNITYSYGSAPVINIVRSFSIEEVTGYIDPIIDYCEDYSVIIVEGKGLSPLLGTSIFEFSGGGVTPSGNTLTFPAGAISPNAYTLDYYYKSQNSCYSDTTQRLFSINALPPVTIDNMESLYDLYGGTDTIYGSPMVIPGTTGIFTPSFMVDNNDGSAIFYPSIAGEGIDTAYYTYTDLNGCSDFDTAVFEVNQADGEIHGIDEFDSHYQYCFFESTTDTVWAIANNSDGEEGTFYIDEIEVNKTPGLGKDSIIINPALLTEGDHELRFSYKNGAVQFNITESFHVDVITGLQIKNLADEYCKNDLVVTLDSDNGTNVGSGVFSGDGVSGFNFAPTSASLGLDTITYTFTSTTSGCVKSIDSTTIINKIPDIGFESLKFCVSSVTDSVFLVADTTLLDNVTEWSWRVSFNTIQESDSVSPEVSLVKQEKNRIELTLKNNKGCSSYIDTSVFVGSKVALDFTWDNECDGADVIFTVDPYSKGGVDTIFWSFGEFGTDTILPPFDDPIDSVYVRRYRYAETGEYNVTYSEHTATCDIIDTTKTITIRPSITVNNGGYFDDFEEAPGISGWAVDVLESSANTSWQWGPPSGSKINSAASGSKAFVTDTAGNYNNNEYSVLSSPCFDLSSLDRPMISFDFISAIEENRDGALLEYSTVIDIWQQLGVAGDGVYWFNSNSIVTDVLGGSYTGWTDDGNGSSLYEIKWRGAKYRLDDIGGLESVRFRLVFGSDAAAVNEGFGFDNIRINSRNRTVLVENFTNQDDLQYTENQGIIDEILELYPVDATAIQYFTSYPTENDINSFYASGPSARSLYYGVSLVPYSIVDGGDRQFNYSSTNTLDNRDIVKRMLEESQFKVTVQQEVTGSELEVSSTIKSLNNLTNIKLSARIAVVEKGVEDTIQNILRAMLPDPAGILFVDDWNVNDSTTIYQTWTIPEGVNKDSLITIVYLQDEETKEIYQAGYTDSLSVVTSIEEIPNSLSSISYVAYPNPVSGQLTIRLVNTISNDIEVRLYNNTGSLVKTDRIWKGTDRIEINTDDLPVGVYYLKLQSEDKSFSTKKIIKSN
jgi:Secretion system C-terminal sorting domain